MRYLLQQKLLVGIKKSALSSASILCQCTSSSIIGFWITIQSSLTVVPKFFTSKEMVLDFSTRNLDFGFFGLKDFDWFFSGIGSCFSRIDWV